MQLADHKRIGLKADVAFAGPYNAGGVSALDAASWTANALAWYQSNRGGSAAVCPTIEVLNELAGHWFWGPALAVRNAV